MEPSNKKRKIDPLKRPEKSSPLKPSTELNNSYNVIFTADDFFYPPEINLEVIYFNEQDPGDQNVK